MSDVRKFDDYVKTELNNYSSDVPGHIWDNIVAERERRKPKGFWANFSTVKNLLLLTGVLVAAGTGAWLISSTGAKGNAESNTVTNNNQPSINTPIAKNITPVAVTNQSTGNTTVAASDNNKNITLASSQPAIVSINGIANNNEAAKNLVQGNKQSNSSGNIASGKISTNTTSTLHDRNSYIPVTNNDNIDNKNNSSNQDDLLVNDETDITLVTGGSLLNRLEFTALKISGRTAGEEKLRKRDFPNVALPDCPSIEKDAAGNKVYVEFYAGPDYAIRNLSDTPNSAYLQKRKESTSFSSAFSTGFRYTRVFNNGMSIRAGINFSQINEKFTFVQGNIVQVTYSIDPVTGDTTGAYTIRGTRYKTTHNRYKTFDIPLLIGYEVGNGRLHANINAGAMINVYSWQRGEVLDINNQPVSITTGKGSSPYQYKTNLGVGLTGGVSVYYKLNDQLHLLAEPYVRYNFSTMSKEASTFKQKYSTVGLRLGVRLDLP